MKLEKIIEDKFVEKVKYSLKERTARRLRQEFSMYANGVVPGTNIPLMYEFDYIPKDKDKSVGVSESFLNRWLVKKFRNETGIDKTDSYQAIKNLVCSSWVSLLRSMFGRRLHEFTLIGVPCLNVQRYVDRWFWPLQNICDALECFYGKDFKAENGYDNLYYRFTPEDEGTLPAHIGGNKYRYPQIRLSESLKGRYVVILDDIVNTGYMIRETARRIEAVGGHVIGAIVIGKTKAEQEHKKIKK